MFKLLSLNEALTVVSIKTTNTSEQSENLDLSLLVTLKLNGVDMHAAMFYVRNSGMDVFDVQPSKYLELPGHIEFKTYEFERVVRKHFSPALEVA